MLRPSGGEPLQGEAGKTNIYRKHRLQGRFQQPPGRTAPGWYNVTMKVLFIGGTGIISQACAQLAIDSGIELTLLNRGRRSDRAPREAETVTADMDDPASVSRALAGRSFDSVVNWIAFEPLHIERDIE